MDFGRELWGAYLDRHFTAQEPPKIDRLSGDDLARLVWTFAEHLKPRAATLNAIPFDDAFDRKADEALVQLAVSGDFAAMDTASLGAWKVLSCRWSWSIAGIMLEAGKGTAFNIPVPLQAPEPVRATAAVLAVLGGPGRDVPPEWCERSPTGGLDQLLSRGPAWPQ